MPDQTSRSTLSLRPLRAQVGSPTDPFHGDRLDRRRSVELLRELLGTVTEPFVLSIEGRWGSGKTTFVQMLRHSLGEAGHPTFYFNAWDNDFAVDPLVAVMGELNSQFADAFRKYKSNAALKAKWRKTVNAAANVGGALIPILFRAGTAGLVGVNDLGALRDAVTNVGDDLGDLSAQVLKEQISRHGDHQKSIAQFKRQLADVATALAGGKTPARLPIVVFVDELDRCKPVFAVALLERIKHIMNVPGVCFVLSIDRAQLATSIQLLYGANTDSTGYLRRFIELEYQLPSVGPREFIQHLFDRSGIAVLAAQRRDGQHELEVLLKLLPELVTPFGLTLRDQERAVLVVELAFRIVEERFIVPAALIALCAVLKVKNPDLYQAYIGGGPVEPILQFLRNSASGNALLGKPEGVELEVYLRLASGMESERIEYENFASPRWGVDDKGRRTADERSVQVGSRLLQLKLAPDLDGASKWMRPRVAQMIDLSASFGRT